MFVFSLLLIPLVSSFTIKFNYNVPFICEVHGIDAADVDRDTMNDLKHLFRTTPVLVFKNQHLTAKSQFEFTSEFDPYYTRDVVHPFQDTAVPDCPQIAIRGKGTIGNVFGIKDTYIQNAPAFRYNKVWHQDLVGTRGRFPIAVSSMYMLQPSEEGGSTWFASMERAYDNMMSDNCKLAPLRCMYSSVLSLDAQWDHTGYVRMDDPKIDLSRLNRIRDDVEVQPLVIYPDSKSQRRSLMLSPNKFIGFVGMPPKQSRELMHRIMDKYVLHPTNVDQIRYDKNDLVLFNNRKVIHSSSPTEEVVGNRLLSLLFLNTRQPLRSII